MRWLSMRRSSNNGSSQHSDANINTFSLNLFAAAAAKKYDVALSPVCIAAVTGLALAGATEDSVTQSELNIAMHVQEGPAGIARALRAIEDTSKEAAGVKLTIGTSVWVADGVRDEYQNGVAKELGAEIRKLPRDDAAEINNWVSKKTDGMISRILDEIESNTVALLVSAVYFKGAWTHAFAESETVEDTFRGAKGDVPIRMMIREGARWSYSEVGLSQTGGEASQTGGILKLLDMPYGDNGRYSAVIGLPALGASVDDAISAMGQWESWMEGMDQKNKVQISRLAVPRFKIQYGVETMKPALQEMGIKAAWGPPKLVGGKTEPLFEKMSKDPQVYLSDILHKAVIEVTEEGTKAAAASVAVIQTRSLSPAHKIQMIVDKPFLFAIRDTATKSVLFLARVDNPIAL